LVNMSQHKYYLSAWSPSRARRRFVSHSEVRPKWLGLWTYFYRKEELTCHLYTRNAPESLTQGTGELIRHIMTHTLTTAHTVTVSAECLLQFG
jgi:hypothetical protein